MDRSYVRTSSLARKFFEDFPTAEELPLLLPSEQQDAFQQYVLPLLQVTDTSTSGCVEAVEQLLPVFGAAGGFESYSSARAAADYVQSPLALCILDTAAAFSLLPGAAALSSSDPTAFQELLVEDLQRRALANILDTASGAAGACGGAAAAGGGGGGVEIVLDQHPSIKAATPCPGDSDRLLVPDSAVFRCCSSGSNGGSSSGSSGSNGLGYYLPFRHIAEAARQKLIGSSDGSSGGSSGSNGGSSGSSGHSVLKRAVWRRRLTRECSHYLEPILGKEGAGVVVLGGARLASIAKGYSSSSEGGSTFQVSFAGFADAAAAQASLEGCLTEVLTRYFARHPHPVTDATGAPVHPLAVATAHHLLLLLPEPTSPQLPTAVGLDHTALIAAAAAGAGAGPAAAAAAAADPAAAAADPAAVAAAAAGLQPPQLPAAAVARPPGSSSFRDVALCFDLALHPSVEALLLSAPNQLAAFAYDGDNIHTLPSAVRALCSGALLLDPSAVARGSSWCGDAELQGEPTAAAAAGTDSTGCGASKLVGSAALGPNRVAAAVQQVRAAAAGGWQPLLLLPLLLPAAGSGSSGSSAPLLPESGGLWQQLIQSDAGSILEVLNSREGVAAMLSSNSQQQQQQQHWSISDLFTLASAPAVAAAATQSSSGSSDGEVSPTALLRQPQLLRGLLTGTAAATGPAAAAAALPEGWAWDTIKLQRQHQQQQQQQPGCQRLPEHLRQVVQSRWWPGPVMRGSLLEGGVGQQQEQ